jgi:hypothetical protein
MRPKPGRDWRGRSSAKSTISHRYGIFAITVANRDPESQSLVRLNFWPGFGCGFSFEDFKVGFGKRRSGGF